MGIDYSLEWVSVVVQSLRLHCAAVPDSESRAIYILWQANKTKTTERASQVTQAIWIGWHWDPHLRKWIPLQSVGSTALVPASVGKGACCPNLCWSVFHVTVKTFYEMRQENGNISLQHRTCGEVEWTSSPIMGDSSFITMLCKIHMDLFSYQLLYKYLNNITLYSVPNEFMGVKINVSINCSSCWLFSSSRGCKLIHRKLCWKWFTNLKYTFKEFNEWNLFRIQRIYVLHRPPVTYVL